MANAPRRNLKPEQAIKRRNRNVEQVLKRHICDYLFRSGALPAYYIIPPPTTIQGRRFQVRSPYLDPGTGDIVCCLFGFYAEIEVKRAKGQQQILLKGEVRAQPAGRLSEAQKRRRDLVTRRGGIYRVVSDLKEVEAIVNELRQRSAKWTAETK